MGRLRHTLTRGLAIVGLRALDLGTQTKTLLHTFALRVHASAPFDKFRMIVVLEGGEVHLTPIQGGPGAPQLLTTLATSATSIVRDPWSGRVYAELSDKSIVSFASDGTDVQLFQTAPSDSTYTPRPYPRPKRG